MPNKLPSALGIIPEDSFRLNEARNLGEIVDEDKDSFTLRVGKKDIVVYKMLLLNLFLIIGIHIEIL